MREYGEHQLVSGRRLNYIETIAEEYVEPTRFKIELWMVQESEDEDAFDGSSAL